MMAPADGPFVDIGWLSEHLGHPRLRVVDCRHRFDDATYGESAYRSARVPGAVHFGLKSHLVGSTGDGRSPLPSPEDFARRAAAAGIADDDVVVCYDDGSAGVAARAWWLFRYAGHQAVFVLRDGFRSWSRATEAGEAARTAPASFAVRPPLISCIDAEQTLAAAQKQDATIIDARPP
ncbi:MAG: sulfurtransferase, partial [Parvibaculaceae bacterium]